MHESSSRYANELINMQKCYNSKTVIGMQIKFNKETYDQSAIHLCSQRSCKVQPEIKLPMCYDYHIWSQVDQSVKHLWGQRSSKGQPEVILTWNDPSQKNH